MRSHSCKRTMLRAVKLVTHGISVQFTCPRCSAFPFRVVFATKCIPRDNKGTFQTDSRRDTPRIYASPALPDIEKAISYREEKLFEVPRRIEGALEGRLTNQEEIRRRPRETLFVTVRLIKSFIVRHVVRSSSFSIVV